MAGPLVTTLTIDRIACDGYGMCAELLPERIDLDDWGYPIIEHPEIVKVRDHFARGENGAEAFDVVPGAAGDAARAGAQIAAHGVVRIQTANDKAAAVKEDHQGKRPRA